METTKSKIVSQTKEKAGAGVRCAAALLQQAKRCRRLGLDSEAISYELAAAVFRNAAVRAARDKADHSAAEIRA